MLRPLPAGIDAARHNLDLYRRLIGVQIQSQAQYRLAFWVDVVTTAIFNGSVFLSLALVFERFDNLGGWGLGEVAFLYGLVDFSFGLMNMVFSGFDPRDFGQRVRRGTFDQMLVRPLNITLQVLGSAFHLRRLGRMAQGLVVFAIALNLVDIHWTVGKLVYLPLVILGMLFFFGGLLVIGATVTFWTIESIEVVNVFTYGTNEMIAYPMHIYPSWLRTFFTYILPAALLNYYPALYFLDRPDPFALPEIMRFVAPLAGLIVLLAALGFWQVGLRHYQSTGT